MTARSTFRALSWIARDIPRAIRAWLEPPYEDDPDAYAKHIADLHAQADETERCAREPGSIHPSVKHGPGSPILARESIAAGATLATDDERLADCGLGSAPTIPTPGEVRRAAEIAVDAYQHLGLPSEYDMVWRAKEWLYNAADLLEQPASSSTPGDNCPVHGQWCQTPGPAPWCRQDAQSSAAPTHSPDGATEPVLVSDPPGETSTGIPLSPADAHKEALTRALAEDRDVQK